MRQSNFMWAIKNFKKSLQVNIKPAIHTNMYTCTYEIANCFWFELSRRKKIRLTRNIMNTNFRHVDENKFFN